MANDLDFGPNDQIKYENDYDGDVPQVTYMPYVFMMQEAYAERQKEEKAKAKAFSKVFTPIDKLIMDYLNSKTNKIPYIEEGEQGDMDRAGISNFKNFKELNKAFYRHTGKNFFDYIRGPSDEGPSKRSSTKSVDPKQLRNEQVGNIGRSSSVFMGYIDPVLPSSTRSSTVSPKPKQTANPRQLIGRRLADPNSRPPILAVPGGGPRRSHKPSQKKTSKGKSRSRSRSRSKTRSKSKSKSKTRAKSKSKRR